MGIIAKEIMMGPILPILEYQTPHEGGMLINGILIIPFFVLLGETGIALKLAWLFTALCTFILLYYFMNRFFTSKAAAITSLLFIFSPPFFTFFNLTDTATNNGNLFLNLLIMTIFFHIFFRGKKPFLFFIFGLICGFSIYFDYYSTPMILTCIFFWFAFDKRFFLKKEFLISIASFAIGISPWVYYNIAYNFMAAKKILGLMPTITSLYKFLRLIIYDFPISLSFQDVVFIKGPILGYAYYTVFIVSYIYLLLMKRKSLYELIARIIPARWPGLHPAGINKNVFILTYPIIYILIYSMTELRTHGPFGGSRYLLPLYPFIFIIISLFIEDIYKDRDIYGRKTANAVPALMFSFTVAIALIGNLTLISPENRGLGRESAYPLSCDPFWMRDNIIRHIKNNPGLSEEKRNVLLSTIMHRYGINVYSEK